MVTHTTEVEAIAASQTTTFAELGLAHEVLSAVQDAGYQHPTPIQAQAIPLVIKGRDVMGLAQTGTGKTAAFTLPIVNQLLGGPRRGSFSSSRNTEVQPMENNRVASL